MSEEQKNKMLELVVGNLSHPSTAMRRMSLKTVQGLRCVTTQALEGIVACLAHSSKDLQQDALNALVKLTGKMVFYYSLFLLQ